MCIETIYGMVFNKIVMQAEIIKWYIIDNSYDIEEYDEHFSSESFFDETSFSIETQFKF